MLRCYNLIIKNGNVDIPQFTIGDLQLSVNEDGSLKTKDKNGNEKIIDNDNDNYSKIKHLEVGINNIVQVFSDENEYKIYFDDNFEIQGDEDFSMGDNTIKFLTTGHYFISFNISLDMYSGSKTTMAGYIKSSLNDIVNKSMSYSYFNSRNQGFGSINNSFIYNAIENEEISLYIKRKESSGKFYSVPESTNFNIFRIG
jgi:hypothetical protein